MDNEMTLKSKKITIISVALMGLWMSMAVLITACNEPDCFTADVITPIQSAAASAKGYKLVVIISGMHDKIVLVSLFPRNAGFDICGKPSAEAYDTIEVEDDKKLSKIVIHDKKIDLQYSSRKGITDFKTVPVEFK